MDLANKNILIVGLGSSGIAAARFAKHKGAVVTVTDIAPEGQLAGHALEASAMGISLELGRHQAEFFERADLIVISPGVPHTIGPILGACKKGIPVIGEIEFASRFIREPVIAISGTNGKTTTTTLLGKMLETSGFKVFVGGNIGNPLIGYVDQGAGAQIVVAEISSFQLDTIETFRPKVSVLLNITEDHMDRYPDFEAYVRSKLRIFENQQKDDTAVINASDPLIRSAAKDIKARQVPFYQYDSHDDCSQECAVIDWSGFQGAACIRLRSKESPQRSLDLSGFGLVGRHNLENAAAASLAALAAGASLDAVQSALNDFKGIPHRLESVATVGGVRFFDDSKATNVDAVARALESFTHPLVLIMGGRDKGGTFSVLKELVHKHVKTLIVMGEAREKIAAALSGACRQGAQIAANMQDAVRLAYQAAAPGDVVLLAPGCASFDMYKSYAQRGEDFCAAVRQLKESASSGLSTGGRQSQSNEMTDCNDFDAKSKIHLSCIMLGEINAR
ncbi:MAG: UDP-N-acetylmuramoyl-L-alanine--D-glutamate ligase [Desulfobacterales bacterium]|nr:UDP-N-acetylmuramoyl-L-alanine--D-glutamate ligase [Desulfobacterales bacterium]